jgi:hypothetical protein
MERRSSFEQRRESHTRRSQTPNRSGRLGRIRFESPELLTDRSERRLSEWQKPRISYRSQTERISFLGRDTAFDLDWHRVFPSTHTCTNLIGPEVNTISAFPLWSVCKSKCCECCRNSSSVLPAKTKSCAPVIGVPLLPSRASILIVRSGFCAFASPTKRDRTSAMHRCSITAIADCQAVSGV